MSPDDVSSCAFCNQPSEHRCRPCGRTLCAAHEATPPMFCRVCEQEWGERDRGRSVVMATTVIVAVTAVMFSLFALSIVTNTPWIVALAFASVLTTIPMYSLLEYVMRRRFHPRGNLPSATLRSR